MCLWCCGHHVPPLPLNPSPSAAGNEQKSSQEQLKSLIKITWSCLIHFCNLAVLFLKIRIVPSAKLQRKWGALSMAQEKGEKKTHNPLAVFPFDMTDKGKCVKKVLKPHCRTGRGKQTTPRHMPIIPIKMHSNSFLFSSASLSHPSEQTCLTTQCGRF